MTRTTSGGRAPRVDAKTARLLSGAVRRIGSTKAIVTKAPTDGSGRVTALVSTFGPPPDSQGDIIEPGAFAKSIAFAVKENPGELFPVWYQHGYRDPENAIGMVTAASETDKGLVVEIQLNLANEVALKTYEGLLAGALREWSIGYAVLEEHPGTWQGQRVNMLTAVEILEVSQVYAGANRYTRTLDVKTARPESEPVQSEAAMLMKKIEQAAYGRPNVDPAVVKQVDDVILETKLELIQESLDQAEQGAWEERVLTNMVLDSVPVRVDARMRPVTPEQSSP